MEDRLQETERKLFIAEAEQKAAIATRGDSLARKYGYKNLRGLDAVHRYLIDKHHWLPHQVRNLSVDDLQLLLAGEP